MLMAGLIDLELLECLLAAHHQSPNLPRLTLFKVVIEYRLSQAGVTVWHLATICWGSPWQIAIGGVSGIKRRWHQFLLYSLQSWVET